MPTPGTWHLLCPMPSNSQDTGRDCIKLEHARALGQLRPTGNVHALKVRRVSGAGARFVRASNCFQRSAVSCLREMLWGAKIVHALNVAYTPRSRAPLWNA